MLLYTRGLAPEHAIGTSRESKEHVPGGSLNILVLAVYTATTFRLEAVVSGWSEGATIHQQNGRECREAWFNMYIVFDMGHHSFQHIMDDPR